MKSSFQPIFLVFMGNEQALRCLKLLCSLIYRVCVDRGAVSVRVVQERLDFEVIVDWQSDGKLTSIV